MKKLNILLLIMIMILSVSAVNAADMDESNDLALTQEDSTPLQADNGIEEIQSADDSEILADLGDSNNNFTTLQNEINEEGKSSITLTNDYVRVSQDSDIEINKDFTIDGANTYAIDANNLGGIFKVNSGYTLTLIGVTLKNGNSLNGGAVYNNGNLIVNNCKFLDNTAVQSGGAIYNNGGQLTVTGSTFDGNNLTQRNKNGWGGAAIYDNAGIVQITGSIISNNLKNIVERNGNAGDLVSAAVSSENGKLIVSDSKFINNKGCYGGAILSNGAEAVLTVDNSVFENNFAFNGGAIDFIGKTYTITNSNFTSNEAKGLGSSNNNFANGGAICAQEKSTGSLIQNCNFNNNRASIGAAVSSHINEIDNCNFTSNVADSANSKNKGGFGGAVYNDETVIIKNSNFKDNTGRGRGLDLKNADISNSSFTNTIISVNNKGTVNVTNNSYDNGKEDISPSSGCTVNANVEYGEVPYIKGGTNNNYNYNRDFTFQDLQNIIDAGNTKISLTANVIKAENEKDTFAEGIVISNSLNLDMNGHSIKADDGKVFTVNTGKTLTLKNANVVGDGTSAIVNNGQVTLDVANPNTFENVGDYAIDNKGTLYQISMTTFTQLNNLIGLVNGGIVSIGASNIKMTDDEKETFKQGILIDKNLTIKGYESSKIIRTYIDANNYGRIFNVTEGHSLNLNIMNLRGGNAEIGGAVYVSKDASLTTNKVNFVDNTATKKGGAAIYNAGGNLNISNSVFKENVASSNNGFGAAIYSLKGTVNVTDSEFYDNVANSNKFNHYGNSIYLSKGELYLKNNAINKTDADVYLSGSAAFMSYLNITILNADSIEVTDGVIPKNYLTATVTDDQGNLIYDSTGLKVTINGIQQSGYWGYSYNNKIYSNSLKITLPQSGALIVGSTYNKGTYEKDNLDSHEVTVINLKGTFTDLQSKIDAAADVLDLTYDFAYNADVDGSNFPDGVLINKALTINGNGYTVSGNNAVRIFKIAAETTLKNITFAHGNKSNTNFVGGAIYVVRNADSTITDCIFENNTASASGGAIYSLSKLNVLNSNFTNNSAMSGGAVHIYNGESVIENSVFDNNKATTKGGAIFAQSGLTVSNSNFTANSAKEGSAIRLDKNAIDSKIDNSDFVANIGTNYGAVYTESKLTVSESNFTDNKGKYAGALFFTSNSKESVVKDSNFTNNAGDNGEAIRNVGVLSLNNNIISDVVYNLRGELSLQENTIDKEIVNDNGLITISKINATILENKTIEAKLGETVKLTLKLTDDNGNLIHDPSVKFTVNGGDEIESVFNAETGLHEADYKIADAGLNIVSTTYGAEIIENGAFAVEKGNVSLDIILNEPVVGDNASIGIKLLYDGTGLNGTVSVIINSKEYFVKVEDGEGLVNISDLEANQYPVVAIFENPNYNTAYASDVLYVKQTTALTYDPVESSIDYGAPVTLTIHLKDDEGSPVSGIVNVRVKTDDERTILLDDEGKGTLILENMDAGDYDLLISYDGAADSGKYYNGSDAEVQFTIKPIQSNVEIDSVGISVAPADVEISFTATDEAVINVTGPNGEVEYELIDGNIVLTNLDAGTYTVNVTIKDSNNFIGSSDQISFVVKTPSSVTINPVEDEIVSPGAVNITYSEENGAADIKVYDVDDNEITFAQDGNKIILTDLEIGTYRVVATIADSEDVEGSSDSITFNVVPNSDAINITHPENSTDTVFSINLPENANGLLLVDIDGQHYYANVEKGKASITVPGLAPGNYSANITYTGDDYGPIKEETTVTIPSNLPENALNIPESSETDSPTYSVNLPSDATGYLEVDVDGTKYVAPLVNGSANVTVPGLSEGNHNVTVTYTGDSKYSSASKSTTLNVHIPVYEITQNKNIAVLYSAKASYKVLITKDGKAVGAGEEVIVKYNGKTYTVKTDKNGYATLKLNTKVKVKKYTITATYKGVTVKNTVNVKNIINAKNKKVKKYRKVTKVKVSLKKVNGKYIKAKQIKIKFRGKTYKVKTNNKGVATWKVKKSMLKKLKIGKKYKYRVTFGKDVVTKKLTIKR